MVRLGVGWGDGTPHRHPLAVGGDHQDRPFLGGRWRLDLGSECRGTCGDVVVDLFQRPDAQRQAQEHPQRLGGLGERLFEAEALRPILEEVGKVALGQAKLLIERNVLDFLAFSGAGDEASDDVLAENVQVAALVGLGQSLQGLSVLSGNRLALVTFTLAGQEDAEQAMAQGEKAGHQAAFDGVDALMLIGGLLDRGDHLLGLLTPLEQGLFFGEDHDGSFWDGDIV